MQHERDQQVQNGCTRKRVERPERELIDLCRPGSDLKQADRQRDGRIFEEAKCFTG